MKERMIFVGAKSAPNITEADVREYLEKLRSGEEAWDDSVEGKSKGKTPMDFDEEAVVKGTLVEVEHTSSIGFAMKIALDHLSEDSAYYSKLEAIHVEAKRRAAIRNQLNEGVIQKGIEILQGLADRIALAVKDVVAELSGRGPRGPGTGGVGVETPEQMLKVLITRLGLKNALERLAKAAPAVTQAIVKVAQEAGHKVTTLADAIAALGEPNIERMLGGALGESAGKNPVDKAVDDLLS